MIFSKNQKLVMIGDSITDCGRSHPIGEGSSESIGKGYVALVDALIGAAHPEMGVRVFNMGTGGHTVRDLKARWQRDVLDLIPDWVSVMIGINDVWRQFASPRQKESHVPIDEYERTLNELVSQTLPKVKGMILFTPFYMEPNQKDAMRAMTDRYSDVVRKLAAKHKTILVDTQGVFDELLATYYPATLGRDMVHPNNVGHMAIARAFCKTVGLKW